MTTVTSLKTPRHLKVVRRRTTAPGLRGPRTPTHQGEGCPRQDNPMPADRHVEQRDLRLQRLEAVGRLASGVAHDFNNILTAISAFCSALLDDLDRQSPSYQDALQIFESAKRGAKLVGQLSAFNRKQDGEVGPLILNKVVSDLEQVLRRTLGEDIELTLCLTPDLASVAADHTQVEQIVMNLAINARDAMPAGGVLFIETRNVVLDSSCTVTYEAAIPGPYVLLSVTDTGTGIDPEARGHIFEPFFTTKPVGKGTGLGLATVQEIVRRHRGHVWVYSEVGRGTTFKIYLPACAAAPQCHPTTPGQIKLSQGSATVLVVEDDESVRRGTCRMLCRGGYQVLDADSGAQALRLIQQASPPIQLLLTDVVMPGMSGKELAERVLEHCPDVRVLFVSGYSDHVAVQTAQLDSFSTILEKPFTQEALLTRVAAVLSDQGAT